MLTRARNLLGQSALYALANVVLRGGGYLLIPVFAHRLTTAEYGVLGIASALTNVASLVLMFGLYAAAGRLYFDWPEGDERSELLGVIWLFLTLAPPIVLMLLDRWGPAVFARLVATVPYDPYIRLALWSAYLANYALLPTIILRNREQPISVLRLSVTSAGLSVALSLLFVEVFRQGVLGVLVAGLLANLIMAVSYPWVVVKALRFRWRPDMLWRILTYSLPFWPHALAGWVLNLSDRVLLGRFVPLADIGIYTLGYQVAQALSVIVEGGNQAWAPYFFKSQSEGGGQSSVASLATYFVTLATGLCLAGALLARPAVRLLTPPTYWTAAPVAALIALASVPLAPYYIWANAIMQSKRVAAFPVVTVVAGLTNVGLNLWLIPRWGIWAAAVNTIVGNFLLAGLNYLLAARVYRVTHEYRRWVMAIGSAVAIGLLGQLAVFQNLWLESGARLGLLAGWTIVLLATGFLTQSERLMLARWQWQN